MRMISTPVGLRIAAATLSLGIPLSAVEVLLASHAAWWRIPHSRFLTACVPSLFLAGILAYLILRGHRIGFLLTCAVAALWTLGTAWMGIRVHDTSLGFFALFLALASVIYAVWLGRELGRSYVDPRIKWYQGLPKPLPGVRCEILSGTSNPEFKVSSIDREGAFIFIRTDDQVKLHRGLIQAGARRDLVFYFRDRKVSCSGVPIRALHRSGAACGVGFQFSGLTSDTRKQLGDFVENLKGEGYVD